MKMYIRAMSLERNRAKQQIASFSPTILEHIIKLLLYSDIRPNDIHGWIHTIARSLHNADDLTVKHSGKKLKPEDIVESLFGCMGDDVRDYRRALLAFQEDNKPGKFNYDNKESYPAIEITMELAQDLMSFCYDIVDATLPLLVDKQDHTLEEYEDIITTIYNKLS